MAELAAAAGVQVIECPEAVDGMGHSLAAGVRATSEAGGWIVMLGDMPRVQPATVRAIARALQAGATVAIPRHHGRRGHPVGLNRCLGRRLAELRGDEGARSIVAALAGGVVDLDVDDAGVLADIDTPADLAAGDSAAT
jgi:molybdenum cofactor cytidylyltransferase